MLAQPFEDFIKELEEEYESLTNLKRIYKQFLYMLRLAYWRD